MTSYFPSMIFMPFPDLWRSAEVYDWGMNQHQRRELKALFRHLDDHYHCSNKQFKNAWNDHTHTARIWHDILWYQAKSRGWVFFDKPFYSLEVLKLIEPMSEKPAWVTDPAINLSHQSELVSRAKTRWSKFGFEYNPNLTYIYPGEQNEVCVQDTRENPSGSFFDLWDQRQDK